MLMLRNEMEMTSAEQQSPESRCWATMRGGHRLVLVVQTCKHYLVTVLHLTVIVTIIVTSWGVIVVFTPSLAPGPGPGRTPRPVFVMMVPTPCHKWPGSSKLGKLCRDFVDISRHFVDI